MRALLVCFVIAIAGTGVVADVLHGRVVKVSDGETVSIMTDSKEQYVIRLQGIDAPERGQEYGASSKEHLATLIEGKHVTVSYTKHDRYGRIVGKILMQNRDINLEQIQSGYAWHHNKHQGEQTDEDHVLYAEAEKKAKQYWIGLWQDPKPTPPWEYRRTQKGQ